MEETSPRMEAQKMAVETAIEQVSVCEELTATESLHRSGCTVKILDDLWIQGGAGGPSAKRKTQGNSPAEPIAAAASNEVRGSTAVPGDTDSKPRRQSRTRYVEQTKLDAEVARLQQLSAAAIGGDTVALDQLRVELDRCPHIWRRLADLQHSIECKMADRVAEKDLLKLEAIRKRSSELRHELTKGTDSLIVKMAASRFVACWIFAQFVELRVLSFEPLPTCIKTLLQAERRVATAMRSLVLAKTAEIQQRRLENLSTV
jgi:hypothetical protein